MRRPRHSTFPEALGAAQLPLLQPLENLDRLVADLEPQAVEGAVACLRSGRSRLAAILEDARGNRPQVVLSGPPKAGKSTLAVGLAREPVTKVTSLPTLAAPVRIAHGRAWGLSLERHDGSRTNFADPTSARLEVQASLRAWSEGLRLAEEAAERFEPERHAPRAAAAVHVRGPARGLADSGFALVEQPHVGAAHALVRARYHERFAGPVAVNVLVVRAEDLCRPELLCPYDDLIAGGRSAQFVLNLEASRTAADGPERPGPRAEDPVALIESFRSLGASRAWCAAFDEGRLRVQALALHELAVARLEGPRAARRAPASAAGALGLEGMAAFERELDAQLRDEAGWRMHVRDTLSELEATLGDLQRAFDRFEAAGAPESLQPGVRGLERALEGLRDIRARYLVD